MKVIIYSKEGCQYCDHAKDLCESEGLDHEKVMIEKEELKEVVWWLSDQLTLKYLLTVVTSEHTLNFKTT